MERKLFINNMNSWFSNFIIEEFRTDYMPDSKIKTHIMGTIDPSGGPLPKLFEPKETFIEVGYNYSQEVFDNDILIFNLDDSYLPEVEYVVRGLQNIKIESEKILIIVSNVMTWAETPLKTFTEEEINQEGFNEEEVPEIIEEKEKEEDEKNENINNNDNNENIEENKSSGSKGSEENNKNIKEEIDKVNKEKLQKKETINKDNNEINKIEKEIKNEEDKNITENQKDEQNPDDVNNELEEKADNIPQNLNEEEPQPKKEAEKPKIKTYYYKETEYQKRCPNSRYFYYKVLETLALSNNNPKVKTYIICPGFIYGCGEDFFFDYFRLAWMGHLPYIPIVGEGDNFLPTIHILDLIQLIKRVIEKKPTQKYIFACDRTKNPTMKNILRSIGNSIGGLDIKQLKEFNIENIDIPNYTELKIDLRIKPSSIFDDEKRKLREDVEEYQGRQFPWHCEFGIPENLAIIREEFNLYRNLKPNKIVITGPPCGGKTTLSKFISDKYKLNYYQINQFTDWAKNLNTPLGEETKIHMQEIEENIVKALDEYDHRKKKRKTDPPLDTSQLKKFSSEFMGKILKERLSMGEYATKGYILDNYPKTYEDCVNMFCTSPYDKEKKDEEYIANKNLIPDSVIIINNFSEENLRNKLRNTEGYTENQLDIDNRFNRRLLLYKQQNEYSEENKKLVQDFYKENNIDVYFLDEQQYIINKEEEERKIVEFLERKGPIDNYSNLHDEDEVIPYRESPLEENANQYNDEKILLDGALNNLDENGKEETIKEEVETNQNNIKDYYKEKQVNAKETINKSKSKSKNISKKDIENNTNINNNSEIKEEGETSKKEEEEEKEKENKEDNQAGDELKVESNEVLNEFMTEEKKRQDKLKQLEEREKKLLEKKSEVIRRYLSENVMPLLAKGILNVCQSMPDDPVEALANFLLDNSFNLQKDETNDKLKINDFEKIMDNEEDDND